MPKLHRWIIAKKHCHTFSGDMVKELTDLGANLADGSCEIRQVIHVNAMNRERVIALLEQHGFSVVDTEED